MRSKFRSIFVALVAVMALGAVASASASASAWWVGGTELKASTELASTAKVSQKITIVTAGVTIECSAETVGLTGASISPTKSGKIEHLTFKSCKLVASGCSLNSSTIESKPLTVEAALGSKSPEDTLLLKPATKTVFAEYTIEGESCALAGVVQVTGTAKLTLLKGREELAEQELSFATGSSSELKWGVAPVELSGKAKVKLVSAKAWSFH